MSRISIVGNSGAGKSTLAHEVGEALNLNVLSIDKIYWQSNWVLRNPDSFSKLHSDWVALDSWIIEGIGYWRDLELRLKISDQIIFLDVPIARCKEQAMHRIQAEKLFPNTNITEGCRYGDVEQTQMKVIEKFHAETRPKLLDLLMKFGEDKIQIIDSPSGIHLAPKT